MKTWFEIGLDNGCGTRTIAHADSISSAQSSIEDLKHFVKPGMKLFVDEWSSEGPISESGVVLLDRTTDDILESDHLKWLLEFHAPPRKNNANDWMEWMKKHLSSVELECVLHIHNLVLNTIDYEYAINKILNEGYMNCLYKYSE